MKKSLICMCLLFLLSAGALAVVHTAVADTSDKVEMTEVSGQGDSSVLQNLEITFSTQSNKLPLFWNTTLIPDTSIHTAFSIIPHTLPDAPRPCNLFFYDGSDIGGEAGGPSPLELSETEPLYPLYQAAADHTRPGTTHTEIFTLADVLPDYPLTIELSVPGFPRSQTLEAATQVVAHPSLNATQEELAANKAFLDFFRKLNDTFRIPTPADFRVAISVSKESDGLIYHYGSSWDIPDVPPKDTPFGGSRTADAWESPAIPTSSVLMIPRSYSAFAGDSIYFYLEVRRSDDNALIDYSKTPGYGLYRLHLTEPIPSMDQLELVFPLEADQHIRSLWADESSKRVLFNVATDEEELLYVLDSITGELRQTLHTGSADRKTLYCNDGPVLLAVTESGKEQSFRLFHQEESGDYTEQFTGQLPEQDSLYSISRLHEARMLYDGQRLFLASCNSLWQRSEESPCRLLLQAWDASGPLYAGLWDSSLDRSPDSSGSRTIEPDWFSAPSPITIRLRNP